MLLSRNWPQDLNRCPETQPASAPLKHSGRRQRRTPPPATRPISRPDRRQPADYRPESAPPGAMSGEFVPAQLVPTPCCAEPKSAPPDASGIPHKRVGSRSSRSPRRRTPSRVPATLAPQSTILRDERRRVPSQLSAPNSSSHPSDPDAPVRAAEFGSIRPPKVLASPIQER